MSIAAHRITGMSQTISCPKCNSSFNSKDFLSTKISDIDSFFNVLGQLRSKPLFCGERRNILDESNVVICPSCGHKFSISQYKYFGFLTLKAVKILLIIFFSVFIAIPICILIKDLK